MKRIPHLFAILLIALQVHAGDRSMVRDTGKAIENELRRYARDARDLATEPLRWNTGQWERFALGAAAVGVVYANDERLYESVQRNRSSATDRFAKAVTPFGGRRALDLSALLIIGGAVSHQPDMRDAGRDSLEAELWAAGVVTPLLKRIAGRARPIQNEGPHSFHGWSSTHQSFPSGHATNVFAFATGIASHYDNVLVPAIVYTIATGVAMSRVNDRAHFPSDVLAGALIGRAVAKGVVARHRHGTAAWTVTPGIIDGRPAVVFHLVR